MLVLEHKEEEGQRSDDCSGTDDSGSQHVSRLLRQPKLGRTLVDDGHRADTFRVGGRRG